MWWVVWLGVGDVLLVSANGDRRVKVLHDVAALSRFETKVGVA